MQYSRQLVVVVAAILLALLFGYAFAPFLHPELNRYLAVGLGFGIATFVNEHRFKKNRRALQHSFIAGLATVATLYVLDTIW